MKMPNADQAVIAPEKIRDYLLNPTHRRGAAKARLLLSLGYRGEEWQRLDSDLRRQHLTADVDVSRETDYGTRFEIVAPLRGPGGRIVTFRTVWQIDTGTDLPRLITMYPE
ncbi:MAG: hypothetical protein V3W34_08940 [Phycisphaerae bacterium]